MRRVLARLYPAQDKIAVFMMACLLLALAAFDGAARDFVLSGFLTWFSEQPTEAVIVAAFMLAGFVAALTFPFVRHDFRGLALVVLAVNAMALFVGNAWMAYEAVSKLGYWTSLVFAAYFAGWFARIKNYPNEQVIAARDPQPSEALFAAALCAALLAGALLLGMEWLTAYSLVVAIAPQIHVAIRRRVLDTGFIQEER